MHDAALDDALPPDVLLIYRASGWLMGSRDGIPSGMAADLAWPSRVARRMPFGFCSPATMPGVDAAFEVSPDDPQGLADAVRRAAGGAVVRVVRDGHAVADIMPAAREHASRADRALAIERRQAARFGAPTLEDYRRVYATSGWSWPGDDVVLRDYLVADAS